MKWSATGLLRLKPFDESNEKGLATMLYAKRPYLVLGNVIAAIAVLSALVLLHRSSPTGVRVLCIGIAVGVVIAGIEWNAGLKARALNQLIVLALAAIGIEMVNHL